MRYLILFASCMPIAVSAQKSVKAKTYSMPATVELYKNGQVITYTDKGVTKADTLYSADNDHRISATNVRTTIDHGRAMLPERKH